MAKGNVFFPKCYTRQAHCAISNLCIQLKITKIATIKIGYGIVSSNIRATAVIDAFQYIIFYRPMRPEFLNRVDEVITFRALNEEDFVKIAAILMGELKAALEERGIALSFSDEALSLIAKESYSHKFGARNMRRYIQTNVEDALAERIIADYERSITHAAVIVKGKKLAIETL